MAGNNTKKDGAKFVKSELEKISNFKKAEILKKFFKTGKGEYGEGDKFLGVAVPEIRVVAKKYFDINLTEVEKLLKGKFHEERLAAILILVEKFSRADDAEKKRLFDFYLKNRKGVNNWDLVDLSAPKICGAYLLENKRERKILYDFALSENLWEKRIAIVSTFAFLKEGDFKDTFKISEILLHDKHDLIHKAAGWMLREIGKVNQVAEEDFLKKNHKKMPRTMLRYAIERFDEGKRNFYMKK